MATSRAVVPERDRKAVQAYLKALVGNTRGGQTGVAKELGVSQGAVWKALDAAAAGPDVLEASLVHAKLSRREFVEKHGPPASTIVAVVVAENPGRWLPSIVGEYHSRYGTDPSENIAERLDDLAAHHALRKGTGRKTSGGSQSADDGDGGRGATGSRASKKGRRSA